MEAVRSQFSTIVDVLDRVLDKGLVINADVIISVAGIPLIGVSLRAALAGMETMLEYGIMQDSDSRTRCLEQDSDLRKKNPLSEETVLMELRGACCCGHEAHSTWRIGRIFLTDRRLVLRHPMGGKVLFETALDRIRSMTLEGDNQLSEAEPINLHLLLEGGHRVRLHSLYSEALRTALEGQIGALKTRRGQREPYLPELMN